MFIFCGIPLKLKKGYWYKTYVNYCPVCGREDKERVRQYTAKPGDFPARYDWKPVYDGCVL